MAAIDYTVIETSEGEFDIVLPLSKTALPEDLLFQQVDLLLATWLNDFPYDTTLGMPYQTILDKNFDITTVETIYYDKIKVLVYFKDLQDFVIDIDSDRNIQISFVVVAQNDASQPFVFSI